jgi:hypothetical protein
LDIELSLISDGKNLTGASEKERKKNKRGKGKDSILHLKTNKTKSPKIYLCPRRAISLLYIHLADCRKHSSVFTA